MNFDKKNFKTIQQIDGTGIHSPHDGELKTIAESVKEFMPKSSRVDVETVMQQAGGTLDDVGFGEDFTLGFEIFPGVRIHVVYFAPGTGDDEIENEPDVKFLFSGDAVSLVSSEDLASLADLSMDYLRDLLAGNVTSPPEVPSDLLQRSILQRIEPFTFLNKEDLPDLAAFVGGKLSASKAGWQLRKAFFPGIDIILKYDGRHIDFAREGDNINSINNYAKDQLSIFLLNHCLRFIGTRYEGLAMPAIVGKAFSFLYLRSRSDS